MVSFKLAMKARLSQLALGSMLTRQSVVAPQYCRFNANAHTN